MGRSGSPTDIGGQGILSARVNGLEIRGNRFDGGLTESIDLRASNADVVLNHLSGPGGTCDICVSGLGRYRVSDNKVINGGVPGITVSRVIGLPVPAEVEPLALPAAAETWAVVRNNEVRDHLRLPVGVGLRVEAQGNSAPNVRNAVTAIMQGNLLVNNRFGIIVHGAFTGAVGAPNALTSDANVTLGGNTILQSCQAKLFVSPNSTFRIDLGGDLSWDEAWYGHEAGFGNTLIVNGTPIGTGVRQFYSASGCPAL